MNQSRFFRIEILNSKARWGLLFFLFLVGLTGCRSQKKTAELEPEPAKKIDADADYRAAQLDFRNQDYGKAKQLLKRALDNEPKLYSKSSVLQLLGQTYRQLGENDKAIEAFSKSVELDPENHEALIFRGVVYRRQKKYDLAHQSYQAALKIKPESPTLHISIGALEIFRERFEKAVDHLKLAIEFDPSNPVAHSNLAIAYANLGQFNLAQKSLKEANLLGYKKSDVVQAKIDQLKFAAIKNSRANKRTGN